jgi:hypothetical protein
VDLDGLAGAGLMLGGAGAELGERLRAGSEGAAQVAAGLNGVRRRRGAPVVGVEGGDAFDAMEGLAEAAGELAEVVAVEPAASVHELVEVGDDARRSNSHGAAMLPGADARGDPGGDRERRGGRPGAGISLRGAAR